MAIDPFDYITADSFDFTQCEPIQLQVATPAPFMESKWIHGNSELLNLSEEFKQRMRARDFHICHFCGFPSRKYQELLVHNGQEWHPESVKTACIFCAQCSTLDWVGKMRSGMIIYLPELTQNELNRLLKVIYVLRISQSELSTRANSLLTHLTKRRNRAKEIISDDPLQVAIELKNCKTADSYTRLQKKLKDIRLFSLDRRIIQEDDLEYNQFPQILAYWRSKQGPFGGARVPLLDPNCLDSYFAKLKI